MIKNLLTAFLVALSSWGALAQSPSLSNAAKLRDMYVITDPAYAAGANTGAKLTLAIAAVPSGATIDARMLTGTQNATATITVNKPIVLLWGNSKLVCTVSPCISIVAGGAGTKIVGMGNKSEVNTAATSAFVLMALTLTSNVTVDNMKITGNGVGTDPVNPVVGIDIDRSHYNEIVRNRFDALNINVRLIDTVVGADNPRGNKIHHNWHLNAYGPNNGGYGILHVRALESIIDHETLTPGPFGRHGIYMSAATRKSVVAHNVITGALLAGISVNSGVVGGETITDLNVTSNIITGTTGYRAFGYGMNLTGGVTNSHFNNNIIKDASNDGFLVQPAAAGIIPSALVISGNQISGSELQCMSFYGLQTSTVSANRCGGNGVDSGAHGPLIEYDVGNVGTGNSINNVFDGNSADSTVFRYGIQLDAPSGLNKVFATRGRGMSRERVNDLGNGTNGYNLVEENMGGSQTLASAAGILTFDAGKGSNISVTLTENITSIGHVTYSPIKGQPLTFIFTQDGTGGRTVAFDATFKMVAWSNAGNAANTRTAINFTYDGSFWQQTASQVAYH